MHTSLSATHLSGGSDSASRQQVVTPGSQIWVPQGSIMSLDMSMDASWVSTNLQPWVGAPPQQPDICVTIAAPANESTATNPPPISASRSPTDRRDTDAMRRILTGIVVANGLSLDNQGASVRLSLRCSR